MSSQSAQASISYDLANCCGVERRTGLIDPVYFLTQVDSTNRLMSDLQSNGAGTGLAVVAAHQTAGKGKAKRFWFSKPGKGIGCSLLLRPDRPLEEISQFTLVLGVAVAEAIRQTTGVPATVKWPNDILVDGRKLCGILCELVLTDEGEMANVIAGIGINVNMLADDIPPELEGIATSLAIESGRATNERDLLEALFNQIEIWTARWEAEGFGPIRDAWIARSCTIGREILFDAGDGRLEGTATDLGFDGSLSVRDRSGTTHRFYYGEAFQSPNISALGR
ncbi:BirA family biotin operon repressor/biotin-[acetyl-CoA-carboxylase] ligase [Breoghania corrubedonensis]|uniref:BirA family biotin operon repressor/biotin-[acetyl-CoA-carboxylase] ligase n=1 Tax=Breoghania corrubedonensis TaxID=665038 RepID=A0A2T5V9K3_9HYPH|nr:biotin--[acetyl-CoA-carboxylase] ligase [Breoghania corrubedonensis]PTW60411.1 BirA family biotin operon repressor/biotin-[acetyl-CoA-carboxylase] ligase [Breoghania corrubedonensis]